MTDYGHSEHSDDVRTVRVISDVVTALGRAMQCARTVDDAGWRQALGDARDLIADIRARSGPEVADVQRASGARVGRS